MEYGCIGEKLQHSFSKEIHEKIGNYQYELREIKPYALAAFFEQRDFKAINVTIPYKNAVIGFLDEIDDAAASIGAVNTVVNKNGRLAGFNTDCFGLQALLKKEYIELKGKTVLILGSGGTAHTAAYVSRKWKAEKTVFVSRTPKADAVSYAEAIKKYPHAEVIINTTPVGMYPQIFASPIELNAFPALQAFVDVIYNPLRSAVSLAARRRGVKTANGLYMLTAQAVKASSLFSACSTNDVEIEAIYRCLLFEKQNIVLIGMPGCGKTTVGRLLAQRLHRPFYDTDELIYKSAGKKIADIITQHGEPYFRSVENETIKNLAEETGCVIATGGGAVLSRQNTDHLGMNGILVFLNRSPQLLAPSPERPLSATKEDLLKRYEERIDIYRAAAEVCIEADASPEYVAAEIERRLTP